MSANFPCSICDFVFGNPRELGTHILTAHCNDNSNNGGGNATNSDEVDTKSNITLITTSSKSATTATAGLMGKGKNFLQCSIEVSFYLFNLLKLDNTRICIENFYDV